MEILSNGTEITYFGHSTFGIKTPGGKDIIIDPWIETKPLLSRKTERYRLS